MSSSNRQRTICVDMVDMGRKKERKKLSLTPPPLLDLVPQPKALCLGSNFRALRVEIGLSAKGELARHMTTILPQETL